MTEQNFTIEELNNEIWKPIADSNNRYAISNLGRIKRVVAVSGAPQNKILRLGVSNAGYGFISLRPKPQEKHTKYIHQLVAKAFLGESPQGLIVNHKDGNKLNNRLENLEYTTRANNNLHAVSLNLFPTGDRNGMRIHPESVQRGSQNWNAKLNEDKVAEIKQLLKTSITISELSRRYNVSRKIIQLIRSNQIWKHV